ncbi:phage tail protein [Sphingomonas immobilis]|uniref:Tail fiber protein n=1 Tax=Sphingomonas immobilis TaxID=3063997 RepID=A0ABT9A329_9SPHN|nr:tail fiber protein [Sphingomonas sp. CA1-15]MDO7843142.1 tail fiber protein [Sphingomonas sp. CA1-15]
MSEPYIGEIRLVGFSFAPASWALCEGQILSIAQNSALFSILGTTYGGNGQTTFQLPDLRGRAAMHWGTGPGLTNRVLGEVSGVDTVTLNSQQMPAHLHQLVGGTVGTAVAQKVATPASNVMFGQSNQGAAYSTATTPPVLMSPSAIGSQGGSQPHTNIQPRLRLRYIICLQGIFPSRN